MRTSGLLLTTTIATMALLGACNSVTGVEDIVFQGQAGDGGSTKTTTGSGGSAGTTDTSIPTATPVIADATGVSMTQIALYQGVKATLMLNGTDAGNQVPIVANRDAVMRVWLATDPSYDGKPIIARLTIEGVPDPIELTVPVNSNPQDNTLNSTLNFDIPGASVPPGFKFRIDLLQPAIGVTPVNPGGHYPPDGFAATNAQSVGQTLKIVLVPFKYGGDGSNRLPDTSAKMIDGYRDLFYAMYPTPAVEITVRDAVQYNQDVSPNGSGWDSLLGYLGDVRSQDNAPFDVYYYGIFAPAQGVNQFCGGGCVAGLGNIAGVGDSYSRAAIGLGFSDDGGAIAWETAVHEIGHTHGRYHSPCGGAAGTDPQYPYPKAQIGVQGYNLLTQKLYNPTTVTDVMGYCTPIWVSDFTWKGFYTRIKAVNGANIVVPPEMMNLTYDRARIDAEGNLHWMTPVHIDIPPQNEPMDVTVKTPSGTSTITGHFYGYDHLPGGVVLWPQAGGPSTGVSFQWQGQVRSLAEVE